MRWFSTRITTFICPHHILYKYSTSTGTGIYSTSTSTVYRYEYEYCTYGNIIDEYCTRSTVLVQVRGRVQSTVYSTNIHTVAESHSLSCQESETHRFTRHRETQPTHMPVLSTSTEYIRRTRTSTCTVYKITVAPTQTDRDRHL